MFKTCRLICLLTTFMSSICLNAFGSYGDDFDDEEKSIVIYGDLLYWRVFQGGLGGCGTHLDSHQWSYGVRAGVEYGFDCSNWDIGLEWVHLDTSNGKKKPATVEQGRWYFDFDTIDLATGYEMTFSNDFGIRPYLGLRYAKIHQKTKALFSYLQHCTSGDTLVTTRLHERTSYHGVGPLLGVDGQYLLGCNISLYGDLGGGFLYGKYGLNRNNFESYTNPSDTCSLKSNCGREAVTCFVDVEVGFQWNQEFCGGYEAVVRLGLEHHEYFNFNQLGGYGDLSLDGLNLSLGVEF